MEYILKPSVHLNSGQKAQAEKIADRLSLDPVLAEILLARGVDTEEKVKRFLHPAKENLHDPFLFRDMEKAAALIRDSVSRNERIWIHGDYDADGTSGSALLWRVLRAMGAQVSCFIPDRTEQGYGLTREAVDSFQGWGLLITVDCGISNAGEIAYARSLGMKTIVTDHHTCPETLPEADAVLNPRVPGETYPFRDLCGAGVAFKLAQALVGDDALQYIDLAAFGTVADMMPLLDENRVIAALGLEKLNRDPNPGLASLNRELEGKGIDAEQVSFRLAPCINAAGRMSSAVLAFNLLTEDLPGSAAVLSKALAKLNLQRRQRQQEILTQVDAQIAAGGKLPDAVVLADPGWETGLVGLAAGYVAETYNRPALLLGEHGGMLTGSARSVEGLDIYAALDTMRPLYEKFGGHPGAAGLTVAPEHLEELREGLNAYVKTHYIPPAHETRTYDVEISLPADPGMVRAFERLEPCGQDNPRPRVLVRNAALAGLRGLGEGRHAGFRLKTGTGELGAVLFRTPPDKVPPAADAVGTLGENAFRGGEPQMIVSVLSEEEADDRLFLELAHEVCAEGEPAEPWRFYRDKPRMGLLYSAIRASTAEAGPLDWRSLYHGLRRRIADVSPEEYVFAVCVFTQLKLLEGAKDGKINVIPGGPKRDLAASTIYRKFSAGTESSG